MPRLKSALLLGTLASIACHHPTFTNPIFTGADPWVTYVDSTYYYSEAGCNPMRESICIKKSKTLTGLIHAPWTEVWRPSNPANPNGSDVWAPEIHKLNNHWFIYYAADPNKNNQLHRLFVLRADTDNPLGTYSEADTGAPHGALPAADIHWAIDPDVFLASDHKLYLLWSGTNFEDSKFPQRIFIAPMSDPEHMAGEAVPISNPIEAWETRDAAIQEGPIGYSRAGSNFVTYSASASWIPNDYAVGILVNRTGNLLDPQQWNKSGPIFDHHGAAYGPGSVVFVPSPDGLQFWNLYHAIDRLDCKPAYNCRDIRMQPMHFRPDGFPMLGVPYDPGVPIEEPSGDN